MRDTARTEETASVVVGRAIRARREALGATQHELARLAGHNPSNFGLLERGATNPTLASLLRVATALGVTVSELTTGIGPQHVVPPEERYTVEDFLAEKKRRSAPDH